MRQQYTIVIERAPRNYAAYAPDVPGCVTTGRTVDETKQSMAEALQFHFEGMREDGEPIPAPVTRPDGVADAAPDDLIDVIEVEVPNPSPFAPSNR